MDVHKPFRTDFLSCELLTTTNEKWSFVQFTLPRSHIARMLLDLYSLYIAFYSFALWIHLFWHFIFKLCSSFNIDCKAFVNFDCFTKLEITNLTGTKLFELKSGPPKSTQSFAKGCGSDPHRWFQ